MVTKDWPPKLDINKESILQLFTGETFYSSVDASIREAILNSIDALGRRQDQDTSLDPHINVEFDHQSRTISISDNGDGMGKDQVANLFATVGASAAQIAADTSTGQYKAVGEFGIGVLSYFLVCERFHIHTMRPGNEPLGLEFQREMLDAMTPAVTVEPERDHQGTNLLLFVDKKTDFDQILTKFPHWIRDVTGLTARELPGNTPIQQGGISREVKPVSVSTPDWIHAAHIRPPILYDSWDRFDGAAHVDILYRGVFVASVRINGLWAIEGAIHVDPKHFRPKLNREGFVGHQLETELEPVLKSCHPAVLERAIECVREVLRGDVVKKWSLRRWVTLWLAVPRSGRYQVAARLWDEEFRSRKAFRLLTAGNQSENVSIRDLEELGLEVLYIAPHNLSRLGAVTQQAVRVLRNSGELVVQGINRESSFLQRTTFVGASTGDLLVNHFRDVLPKLIQVEAVARDVITREAVTTVFSEKPVVQLVRLGRGAAPILPVGDKIWINIEHDKGKEIVRIICARNEGHMGLWFGCIKFGPEHAQQIANILSTCPERPSKLGPIRRRFLMRTIN